LRNGVVVTRVDGRARREKVAVVGSGVAGLTAGYLLQRRFDVTLFEAAARLGGHAHTHQVVTPDAGSIPVDSGFIVYNDSTYPQLRRLLAELDVDTQPADMSMSVRCEGCGLEYAGGRGPGGLFARPRSAVTPAFLKMLLEIGRFHRRAKEVVVDGDDGITLRSFLTAGGFSNYFVRHFMVPVVSCVWSAPTGIALEYPARYLFVFLENHGMLSVTGSPVWRTIRGGSTTYVERIVKGLHAVHTGTRVRSVTRTSGHIEIRDECDQSLSFDRVVIATHADQALEMLTRCTESERAALGAFGYARNATLLHTDESLLPGATRARSSWNYLLPGCEVDTDRVLVSYDMNRLQSLPSRTPYIVTLNATDRIDPSLVVDRMLYEHPIYTLESVAAQQRLPGLNDGTIAFAGAYHGWGFHEDGCRSGVAAAASLGVTW
jgi:predicted NAD/FAD-binding protein